MTKREAKMFALGMASRICLNVDSGFAPDDMEESDVEKILYELELIGAQLQKREDRLAE